MWWPNVSLRPGSSLPPGLLVFGKGPLWELVHPRLWGESSGRRWGFLLGWGKGLARIFIACISRKGQGYSKEESSMRNYPPQSSEFFFFFVLNTSRRFLDNDAMDLQRCGHSAMLE